MGECFTEYSSVKRRSLPLLFNPEKWVTFFLLIYLPIYSFIYLFIYLFSIIFAITIYHYYYY